MLAALVFEMLTGRRLAGFGDQAVQVDGLAGFPAQDERDLDERHEVEERQERDVGVKQDNDHRLVSRRAGAST